MLCDNRQFGHIGSGYVLLFSLLKYLTVLLALCSIVVAQKIIRNLLQAACPTYQVPCVPNWILAHSVANYGLEYDYVEAVSHLNEVPEYRFYSERLRANADLPIQVAVS